MLCEAYIRDYHPSYIRDYRPSYIRDYRPSYIRDYRPSYNILILHGNISYMNDFPTALYPVYKVQLINYLLYTVLISIVVDYS